jgi:PBP1b-binding outer membrane lipoprotein LpoB
MVKTRKTEAMMIKSTLLVVFVFALLLSACSPAAEAMEEKPAEAMIEEKTPEAMMEETPEAMVEETPEAMVEKTDDSMMEEKTPEAMMEKTPDAMMDEKTPEAMDDEMMEAPAWFGAALNNVSSGEDFTINDFRGKVILVETLAMWCPSCKRQQVQVKALHEALGIEGDLVSIGLDIDPNENAADLKAYTEANGFDWIYAVAPAEVAREIGALYGDQFLNPPSTPILIIDRHGQAHPLPFGVKSAADLQAFIEPFLKEGM